MGDGISSPSYWTMLLLVPFLSGALAHLLRHGIPGFQVRGGGGVRKRAQLTGTVHQLS